MLQTLPRHHLREPGLARRFSVEWVEVLSWRRPIDHRLGLVTHSRSACCLPWHSLHLTQRYKMKTDQWGLEIEESQGLAGQPQGLSME